MRRRLAVWKRRASAAWRVARCRETAQTPREIALGLGAVVVGVAVVAGAYTLFVGGGDDDSGSTDFRADARRAANSTVLKLEEMPPGWTLEDSSEGRGFDIDLSDDCDILETNGLRGNAGYTLADQFRGPNGQSVITDAAVFESPEKASRALDDYVDALARCELEMIDAIDTRVVEDATTTPAAGPDAVEFPSIVLEDLPAPDLGDAAVAYRITIDRVRGGAREPLVLDVEAVLTGRILCGITYRGSAIDEAAKYLFAATLTIKAARANGTLAAPQ